MKKIIIVSNTASSIEKFRIHYLNLIPNCKIDIYTPFRKVKLDRQIKNIKSIKFSSINFFQEIYLLHKIISSNIDALFVIYSFKYQFLVGIIRLFREFRSIFLIAGKGSFFYQHKNFKLLIRSIFRLIFNKIDKIICINPDDKSFFSKYLKKKVSLIPTEGISKFKTKKRGNIKKNFIFFGRIIKEKGILEYIEIAKHFKKKNNNLNFFVAGPINKIDIGQTKSMHNISNILLSNKQNIKYLGDLKNYKKILPKMDCLVSPSYTEGAGTSVMESLVSGLFVIAYKNNGHKYVLKDTKNLLVNQNIPNLINGIDAFLKMDKKKLLEISALSKNKVLDNFNSKKIFESFKKNFPLNYNQSISVAILIATFNHEKFIMDCLISIKNQTYHNLEIIISDDYSKDKTIEKIEDFIKKNKNLKIKFFRQNKNLGISKNYNFLYSKAKSNYIVFFGGDDVMYNKRIDTQLNILLKYPTASFAYSNCAWYNHNLKIKYFDHYNIFNKNINKISDILQDLNIPSPTLMIPRKYLQKKPFNEKINYYSDLFLTVDLYLKSKPIFINKVLVKYRQHRNSVTKLNLHVHERLLIIDILKKKFSKNKKLYKYINMYLDIYNHNKIYDELKSGQINTKLILNSIRLTFRSSRWFVRNFLLIKNLIIFTISKDFFKK